MGRDWKTLRIPKETHSQIEELAEHDNPHIDHRLYGIVADLVEDLHAQVIEGEPAELDQPEIERMDREVPQVGGHEKDGTGDTKFRL